MQQWRISMEQINYHFLSALDAEFGTPYYIMDGQQYKDNIRNFLHAFSVHYPKVIAGYSFKTNYVPALCKIAKEEGVFAEVVSEMEYALAKKLGFEQIIFNGPIKKEAVLKAALNEGCIVNLDSWYEVETVLAFQKERNYQHLGVGIRLNVDLKGEDGVSHVQCGLREGRFGFTKELLPKVVKQLSDAHVDIISIHGHTSSSDRAVQNYCLITKQMLAVCEQYSLNKVAYFDVGGGFFGAAAKGIDVSNKPKYEDYAQAILNLALNNAWFQKIQPYIVIEPGVSVVANVFHYVSKLFQHKVINGQHFMSTDGSVFDVKPTLHSNNLPHEVFLSQPTTQQHTYNVVGSTCMEKDVILKEVELPEMKHGDYLMIHGVGAYTVSLTPTFINFLSPILCLENGGVSVVRRRQNIEDITELYNW